MLAECPPPAGHSGPRPMVWKQDCYPVLQVSKRAIRMDEPSQVGCNVLAKDPTQLAGYYVGKVVAVPVGEKLGPPGTVRVRYYDGMSMGAD